MIPLADAARAAPMRAYMKDKFPFLGAPTTERRLAILKPLRAAAGSSPDDLMAMARGLWDLPEREYQHAAIDLLARHHKALTIAQLDDLLALAREKSWWDSVDGLAGIVGDVVRAARRADPGVQRRMDAAVADPNLWVRRIAMIHQLGWRADTDVARLFGYAKILAPERDFFIRKAIGWALRDYARHDGPAVLAFVTGMGDALSPLSRREATRRILGGAAAGRGDRR